MWDLDRLSNSNQGRWRLLKTSGSHLTVSANTESFPSAYSLKCLTSAASPNQTLTLSWPGSLASPPLPWGYCRTRTVRKKLYFKWWYAYFFYKCACVLTLRKMVCSCPQCFPQCCWEKMTVCAGMRWYATLRSPCSIQITMSGRLFWGWAAGNTSLSLVLFLI